MVTRIKDTGAMIAGMSPERVPGEVVFCTFPSLEQAQPWMSDAIATLQEAEGLSLILPVDRAEAAGCDTSLPMVQITLNVHSALDGVGLTAAVAGALADAGIACNMVAAFHHDHAFVPADQAERALSVLKDRVVQAS